MYTGSLMYTLVNVAAVEHPSVTSCPQVKQRLAPLKSRTQATCAHLMIEREFS